MTDFGETGSEEVKTGADRLLDLVRNSKEVALSQAAKKLGVSAQTVEAWANFLEEDGLVMVKYRLTTPYIAVPEVRTAGKKPQVQEGSDVSTPESRGFIHLKAELESSREDLGRAMREKQTGEFGELNKTYDTMLHKLRVIQDALVAQPGVSPQNKILLGDALTAIEGGVRLAAGQVTEGKFNEASASYSTLYSKTAALLEELDLLYSRISTLMSIRETRDYKDILEKAYELMKAGKVNEARELYEKLRFADENLAKDFIERKHQMDEDLLRLNKDIAVNSEHLDLEKIGEISRRIDTLLKAGSPLVRRGEFGAAEPYYIAIKHEYEHLPHGFSERKKEIQEKVLAFYALLARERETGIKKRFAGLVKEIESAISETRNALKANEISQAIRLYGRLKRLYGQLPPGFLNEKTRLQERVFALHGELISAYASETTGRLKSKSAELVESLGKMKQHTEKGNIKEAQAAYESVKRLYSEIPKGFLHEETTLQEAIVEAYGMFLKKMKMVEERDVETVTASITGMIEHAEMEMKQADYATAKSAYFNAISAFGSLPKGLGQNKAKLRERILRLYQGLRAAESQAMTGLRESKRAQKPEAVRIPEPPIAEGEEAYAERTIEAHEPVTSRPSQLAGEMKKPEGAPDEEEIEGLDKEIEDIETKIANLKLQSRATVRMPLQAAQAI